MSNNGSRTGIVPVETVEKYEITTAQVQDYLQKRINMFTSAGRNKGDANIEDIPISVTSIDFSKKFVPFMIILPEEAIAEKNNDGSNGTWKVFQDETAEASSQLVRHVWSAIVSYCYTKNDRKAFLNSPSLKKTLLLTGGTPNKIANHCSPKIIKASRDQKNAVCLLDPIRVFSDIIRTSNSEVNKDGSPRYLTIIEKVEKLSADNYKYTVIKEPKKSKDKTSGPDILQLVKRTMKPDGK